MTFTDEDLARFREAEAADLAAGVVYAPAAVEVTSTSWAPIPLDEILDGDYMPPIPTMLARTDGPCLLYPERSHSVSAEPEALKTWLALGASAEQLGGGGAVLYIDFETSGPEIVGRLRALGVDAEVIRQRFMYVRPDEPLAAQSLTDLDIALERKPTLVVIDGMTEAYNRQGLNPLDNADVATWLELLPRRIVRAGSSTLMLDHVVKDKEQRGRYAIGAQHKLAGVDVAYSLHVVEPFGRGRTGVVTIKVQKDRPGGVREHAKDGHIATLRATSHDDDTVSLSLDPPEPPAEEGDFRPTRLMLGVSEYVDAAPGASTADIEANVRGKSAFLRKAIACLVDDDCIRREKDGAAWRHYVLKPFSPEGDTPDSSLVPNSSRTRPDEVMENSSLVPSLKGGRGRERKQQAATDDELVLRAEQLTERHRGPQ